MITGADAWHTLPGHGQHVLRYLYQAMICRHRQAGTTNWSSSWPGSRPAA
jgi:hypothetical protein